MSCAWASSRLYLVQHGLADGDLTAEGRAETELIAGVAAGYGVEVSRIVHSGKLRAQQTAAIMAAALSPAGGVGQADGLNPNDDISASEIEQDRLMIVGHQPFLGRLCAWLITGSQEKSPIRFRNSGIVCLEQGPEGWQISWSLMPKIG